jgi:tetratricopeptide (TPR) repeat protein
MRETLNLKFLAVLLAATVLFAGGWHFLHAYQVERTASTLLAQADRAQERGRPDRAALLITRYLLLCPGDVDARVRYGQLVERQAKTPRDLQQAVAVYEEALRRNPDLHDVRRRVAELDTRLNNHAAAYDHLRVLRQELPDDIDVEYWLGRAHETRAESAQAAKAYESVIRRAPERIEAYVRLAGLLRTRLGKPDQAMRCMDRMVAANKGSARAYLERAAYLRERRQTAKAAADLREALRLAPDDAEVALAASSLAQEQRRPDDARACLALAMKRHPKDVRLYQTLAAVEYQAGRLGEATACLRQGLKELPQERNLLWALAIVLIEGGALDEAKSVIARLQPLGLPAVRLDYLDADLLVSKGKWAEGAIALERVRPMLADTPELLLKTHLLLAQCYGQLTDYDQQLMASRRAEAQDPTSLAARQGALSALLRLGRHEEALVECRRLMAAPEAPPAGWALLVRLLITQNLRLPRPERRWDETTAVLARAAQANPGSPEIPLLAAEVASAQEQYDTALRLLVQLRDQQPQWVEPWVALANLSARQGKLDESLAILEQAQRRLGFSVDLCLASLNLALERPGANADTILSKAALDLAQAKDADRLRFQNGLAEVNYRVGRAAEARRLWEQAAAADPGNLRVRLLLFDLAHQAGDESGMQRQLAAIRDIEGEGGPLGHYGEARRLVWRAARGEMSELAAARAHLAAAAARRPGWSRVPVCQAQIDELDRKPERALADYLQAVELGERDPEVIGRAVRLLAQRQRYFEADRVLRLLPEATPLRGEYQRLAAEVSLQSRDYARAMRLARKAVAADSADYRDHVWLGQMLWATGRRAEAEPVLRRAAERSGGAAEPWVALVQYLAHTGQKDKAEQAIAAAAASIPADRAALPLAHCHEAAGNTARAEELYRRALAARPDEVAALQGAAGFYLRQGRAAEARALLQRVIGLQERSPVEAAWARRMLALVLATTGDFRQQREALAVLGLLNRGGAPATGAVTGADRQAQALALAAQRGRRERGQAISLLEEVSRTQELSANEQFVLAQLYESVGDWTRAQGRMQELLARHGDEPDYVAAFARSLLQRGQAREASPWVDRLRGLPGEATSFRAAELEARLLAARGQPSQAVGLLRAYIDNAKAAPPDPAARLKLAAALLDDLGDAAAADPPYVAAAEDLYRRLATRYPGPDRTLALAAHLGRRGRVAEALDLCHSAWQKGDAADAANVSLGVLHHPAAKPADMSRVEGWLQSSLAITPSAVGMQVCLADLRDLQGRFAEAESLYRAVLRQDDSNAVALNNLAWLLALRSAGSGDALELINRAIDTLGPVPELLDTRAVVYLSLGRADKAAERALQAAERALQAAADVEDAIADPTAGPRVRAQLHMHLAQAYDIAKKSGDAAAQLAKARSLGLEPTRLHPLERAPYRQLCERLAKK